MVELSRLRVGYPALDMEDQSSYLAAQANRGLEGKFQLFLATLILPKLLVHFWQLLMEVSLRKAQVSMSISKLAKVISHLRADL